MTELLLTHTSVLTAPELADVRALLDAAFDGDFGVEDWDHCLGGLHARILDGGRLLAHGAVVQRRVRHAGRWRRVGYVEALAVRADVRRRGLGGQIMGALEQIVERGHDFGALSASDEGALLYASRGWQVWPGLVLAADPSMGPLRLPDEEGSTYVWPPLAASAGDELVFDWRDGDVL
ncbi:GNAT family N-acetyltransferase [Streptomyces luteolus]|uniref:GNAT family N-acetyltransferase n=1 Tax=Streptomyces luteolus TaxID=3043615 RepID=A0ABT6T5Y9_9ACTN|nr:GNAT family N-acetyltransferase [Streptomyces sp. B-S-A12]MDI3423239.1 GNAT family N-acetyltransferase [Streptomyces sp. B-S-A12]